MQTFTHTLDSLWQVLLIGLAFGAGVPVLFALGIRSAATSDTATAKRSTAGSIAAAACMLAVIAVVIAGILFITKDFLANDLGIHVF